MWRYLVRRILWAIVLFIAVTIVSYIIFFLVPADPARLIAGPHAPNEAVQRVKHQVGLDRPIIVQYGDFLKHLVIDRSLGRSYAKRQEVNRIVEDAAPVTASLVFGGAIVWMLIALPVGILSALRPRSLLDRAAMVFVLVGISAHPVWIGLILSYFIGFKLNLTPLGGYCDFFHPSTECGGPIEWAHAMLLPWITFAILFAALYVRMIRANVLEALNEDYVRTARAKGAPEWLVMRSHVLRNAMLPVVTMLGMDIGLALGGAIFTESVYGLPGLGKVAVESLEGFDLPTVMGITVFATVAIIVFNLIVDLLYAWIDPRIRLT
ncbi:MAG: ABC transporter permease [Actinomycetota bacterium]|nr:ABC transporter permease [Actinomycetota bacterium]